MKLSRSMFACAVLASSPAFAKVTLSKSGDVTTYRFEVDDVRLEDVAIDGRDFTRASLVGVDGYEGLAYDVGRPELPSINFVTTGTVKVRVVEASAPMTLDLADGRVLAPSQPARVKRPGVDFPLVMDQAAYAATKLDAAPFTLTPAGSVDGRAQTMVSLAPLAYEPANGRLLLARAFEVDVTEAARPATTDTEIFAFVVGARYQASPSLAAYQALKEGQGFVVERINVAAGESADSIRTKLKAVYARTDAKLRYALIIGDSGDVAGKNAANISGITDHYYRAIDTDNYASDINGPDIGVGRVAVANEEQLAAVLDKFTRYQTRDPGRWLFGAAFLATDDQWQLAEGTHNYAVETYTKSLGYLGVFPADPTQGGDKLYAVTNRASGTQSINAIKLGRSIVNYSGHGSTTSWAGPSVSQSAVRSLTDPDALPFVISNACDTGDFRTSESFAETWQRHPSGAITFWGSMDSSYWDEDDVLERAMFDGIFTHGKATFGDITSYALGEVWRRYGGSGKSKYYWETYVTFGDPSIQLRTPAAL